MRKRIFDSSFIYTKIHKKVLIGLFVLVVGALVLYLWPQSKTDSPQEMKSQGLVSVVFQTPEESVGVGGIVEVPIILENNGLNHERGEYASAADIALSFPSDQLELISIEIPEEDPLMTVELQSSLVVNEKGAATFTYGVPPDPSTFKELPGTLAILTFQAKMAGNAILSFTKAQVAATQVDGDVGKGESAVLTIQ